MIAGPEKSWAVKPALQHQEMKILVIFPETSVRERLRIELSLKIVSRAVKHEN